jgi:hypothetical protein
VRWDILFHIFPVPGNGTEADSFFFSYINMLVQDEAVEDCLSQPESNNRSKLDLDLIHEHVVEILAVMRKEESTTYCRADYLKSLELGHVLDSSWRQRIIEWMYGVVDHCSLRRDSVATAAYYLDICVEKGIVDTREDYQLAAMTSLQIAIKLCDSTVVKLQSMVALGRGLFTEQDVIAMESKILFTLDWHMHPSTPVCYLRQYLRLLPTSLDTLTRYMIAEVTRFISEISVCLYKFVLYPPSVVAYAGMLIAMERIGTLSDCERSEIYGIMSRSANLEQNSELVEKAVRNLQESLEKNVSLQELMNNIDAQCTSPDKVRAADKYSKMTSSGDGNSPRDVVTIER